MSEENLSVMQNPQIPAEKETQRSSAESAGDSAPKISVIVPVYKVEKYLPECIESVLAQTFTDFELILVDDGSPDGSGAICDVYAKKDSRIRVFHKPNGGVTSARRLGVERSRAEWLTFVDSDDELFPNAISDLIEHIDEQTDVVEGTLFSAESYPKSIPNRSSRKIISTKYRMEIGKLFLPFLFCKLFRKELLLGTEALVIPREIIVAEDMVANFRLGGGVRKATKIEATVYFYRINPHGACGSRIGCSIAYNELFCDFLEGEFVRCRTEDEHGVLIAWMGLRFIDNFLYVNDVSEKHLALRGFARKHLFSKEKWYRFVPKKFYLWFAINELPNALLRKFARGFILSIYKMRTNLRKLYLK